MNKKVKNFSISVERKLSIAKKRLLVISNFKHLMQKKRIYYNSKVPTTFCVFENVIFKKDIVFFHI